MGKDLRNVDVVSNELQRLEVHEVTSPVKDFKTDRVQDPKVLGAGSQLEDLAAQVEEFRLLV